MLVSGWTLSKICQFNFLRAYPVFLDFGWQRFTGRAITVLSEKREHLVFLLWGRYAKDKARLIDPAKHLILMAPHPSPFSACRGFFGCRHFSKANHYLARHGIEPIDWRLPD